MVMGAIWGYFKFIKDRVYRPRLDIALSSSIVEFKTRKFLLCRISVKNIGATRVRIVRDGTALTVSSGRYPAVEFVEPTWVEMGAYDIFGEHAWIESSEVSRHDILVSLDDKPDQLLLLDVHLVCKMPRQEIGIHGRFITPSTVELTKRSGEDDQNV